MANKKSKDLFKKLKKLTQRQRMQEASHPEYGQRLLSLLTPTQYAELFPDYFRRGLPDVGGFRDAITKKTQAEQQKYYDEIDQKIGSTSPGGAGGGTYTPYKGGKYTPSQAAALARSVGATPEEAQFLGAVTRGESSGDPTRHNDNYLRGGKDDSYGLWQVNMLGSMGDRRLKQFGISRKEDLYDPKTNAKAALAILREQGRGAWGAYTDMQKRGEWDAAYRSASAGATGNVTMPSDGKDGGGSAPNFGQYALSKGVDNYTHLCGRGARVIAGHMYGHSSFLTNGLGGDGTAGSLSRGNNYFQGSGLFKGGRGIGKDFLTSDYLASLPIGTVISSTGGGRGQGHAQIKIGPNQWASDTVQSHFLMQGYDNFVVHEPNEAGLARLAAQGVVQPGGGGAVPQATAQVTPQRTAEVPAAPPSYTPNIPDAAPDIQEETPGRKEQDKPVEKAAKEVQQQTAVVNKPEPTNRTFEINRSGLISAIKQTSEFKNTFGSSLATDDMIYSGFFGDARTQKLMADTKSSFDPNSGRVTIGDYKKFKELIPDMDTSKFMKEVPSGTPSHAGGGREKIRGPVYVSHLHKHYRGDTALVTDSKGKKFTVNPQKENITVNPKTQMMDIKPVRPEEKMDIEKLMAMIRRQESGKFEGDYTKDRKRKGSKDTASGAYQYTDPTWKAVAKQYGLGTEYKRAVEAPKNIQDQLTRTRIEDLRKKGYSDHEIILTHFTGNRAGKLDPKAQRGNPTPAEYRTQMAEHATEYDRLMGPKVAAKSEPKLEASVGVNEASYTPPTSQAQTTPAPVNRTIIQKIQSAAGSLVGAPAATAEPVSRASRTPLGPAPDATNAEIGALRQDMQNMREGANKQAQKQVQPERPDTEHQSMLPSLNVLNKDPINPVQQRMQDKMKNWTGDHYDLGNKQ